MSIFERKKKELEENLKNKEEKQKNGKDKTIARLFKLEEDEQNYFFISENGDRFLYAENSLVPLEKENISSFSFENEIEDILLICYFSQLVEIEKSRRELIEKISKFY